MTRDELNKLCVDDVVEINYTSSGMLTWVVKEIIRDSDNTISVVKACPVDAHRIHAITITDLPEHWTLVEKAISDMHPLEQLQQRLDSSK